MKITVDVTDDASPALNKLADRMSGANLAALQALAGQAAKDEAAAYHREFNRGGGWTGRGYVEGRPGTARGFGERVAQGWELESHTGNGAVISNAAEYYYLKVHGQTLKPRNGGYFTVPLVEGLNGVTPEQYTKRTGRALFRVKGQTSLFEREERAAPRPGGRAGVPRNAPMRAVFSLVKSITHDPWKGAFPPVDRLASAYQKELGKGVAEAIDGVQ